MANNKYLDEANNLNNIAYYKSKQHLPWAIHIPDEWEYPVEKNRLQKDTIILALGLSLEAETIKIGTPISQNTRIPSISIKIDEVLSWKVSLLSSGTFL